MREYLTVHPNTNYLPIKCAYVSSIMARTRYISMRLCWCSLCLLDKHAYLGLYDASSLKQQSVGTYVASRGQSILILNQPSLCSCLLMLCDCEEAANTNVITLTFCLTRFGLESDDRRSTGTVARTLPMWFSPKSRRAEVKTYNKLKWRFILFY